MISDAEYAVAEWQSAIRDLTSIHTGATNEIDWQQIAGSPRPIEPRQGSDHEDTARQALDAFQPRIWDFLFGGSEKRRQRLSDAVAVAAAVDEADYREAIGTYQSDVAEWQADTDLARRLLAGDVGARRDVVAEMQSLSSEGLIGTAIHFRFNGDEIHAIAHIHGDEIVPKFRRKQLQSGRLSESNMPTAEFNELYQDYVCSATQGRG